MLYIYIEWPESQNYMQEDWFREEAILDNSENAPSSSYLIPINRIGVNLAKEEGIKEIVLDLLVSMDMSLNPESYPSSSTLTPEDFCDLALCKAQELDIVYYFEEAVKKEQDKAIE